MTGQGDRLTEAERRRLRALCDDGRQFDEIAAEMRRILRDRARPADEDGMRAAIEALADTLTTFCDVRKHQVFEDKGEDDYNRGIRRAVDDLRAVLAAHPEPTTTEADE